MLVRQRADMLMTMPDQRRQRSNNFLNWPNTLQKAHDAIYVRMMRKKSQVSLAFYKARLLRATQKYLHDNDRMRDCHYSFSP